MDLSFPDEAHEMVFQRGLFLHYYGSMENALNDFLARLVAQPVYAEQGFTFSFRTKTKLTTMSKMLDAEGPLAPFRDDVRFYINTLLSVEPERNMMAHGMMTADDEKPSKFHFSANGHNGIDERFSIDLTGMKAITQPLSQLTNDLFLCFEEVSRAIGMPIAPVEFGPAPKPEPPAV